jgi:hypothetical protein
MPTLVLAVPETYNSVTRPVIYDVTRKLFAWTGLHENTPILYPSPNGVTYQPGSALQHDPKDSDLAFDDMVTIEVDESMDQDRVLSTAVVYPDNLMIFHDPRVETIMKPAYIHTEIAINFKFRAIDEVKAMRWRDQIRMRMSQMRDLQMLDLRYAYQLPPVSIVILEEVHRLMENVAGYGRSFSQWFKDSVSETATVEANFSGKQLQVAIPEHQGRIIGYWDFEGEPEKGSKEDGGETWTISFSFKFKYDKPASIVLQYPQMIHQQLIKYRDDKPVYNPDQFVKSYSLSSFYLDQFNRTRALDKLTHYQAGITLPPWDEFVPETTTPAYIKIFSAMLSLDLSTGGNPSALMNLNELPESYVMPSAMEQFIVGEAPYMTQANQSVFNVALYLSNKRLPDGSLAVDNNLNVTTTFNPNPRARFHLWFGLCCNWRVLSPAAVQRLRMNYPILVALIRALWPNWNYTPDQIGNSGIAKNSSMNYLTGETSNIMGRTGMRTVETFYVQALTKDN